MFVEGLWLLRSPRLRKLFGFRIFLDAPMKLRLRRRLACDVIGRGRSRKSVRTQFRKTVEPMHRKFVLPQIEWSDIVLRGDWDNRQGPKLAAFLRRKTE